MHYLLYRALNVYRAKEATTLDRSNRGIHTVYGWRASFAAVGRDRFFADELGPSHRAVLRRTQIVNKPHIYVSEWLRFSSNWLSSVHTDQLDHYVFGINTPSKWMKRLP